MAVSVSVFLNVVALTLEFGYSSFTKQHLFPSRPVARPCLIISRSRRKGRIEAEEFDSWLTANPLPGTLDRKDGFSQVVHGESQTLNAAAETSHCESDGCANFGDARLQTEVERHDNYAGQLPESSFRICSNAEEKFSVLCTMEPEQETFADFTGDRRRWKKFSWKDTHDVFDECIRKCDMIWDEASKSFKEIQNHPKDWRLEFIPPLIQPPPQARCTPCEYLEELRRLRNQTRNMELLALLSSCAAALGIFKDGVLIMHKVFTAYTIRAKQGKAQLHYLRQGRGGRMSVGGGIRAKESRRLFTRICEKLEEWREEIKDCNFLFYSGNMRVWNEVYNCSKSKFGVPRDDCRWHKIPYNVRRPRLEELLRVYYGLSHGAVMYISFYDFQLDH